MVYGYGNFHLRTQRVSCTKARYLVLVDKTRWGRWNSADYKRQEFWRGPWYCWSRLTGYESGRTICRASSGRRVKWGTAS